MDRSTSDLLEEFSDAHNSLGFILEAEGKTYLGFLVCHWSDNKTGSYKSFCRKQRFTVVSLRFSSFVSLGCGRILVRCLALRTRNTCSRDTLPYVVKGIQQVPWESECLEKFAPINIGPDKLVMRLVCVSQKFILSNALRKVDRGLLQWLLTQHSRPNNLIVHIPLHQRFSFNSKVVCQSCCHPNAQAVDFMSLAVRW